MLNIFKYVFWIFCVSIFHSVALATIATHSVRPLQAYIDSAPFLSQSEQVRAYVISMDDGRWANSKTILDRIRLNVSRVSPVSLSIAEAELKKISPIDWPPVYIRYMSCMLSHERVAALIAQDFQAGEGSHFALVFEDDIGLSVHPDEVLPAASRAAWATPAGVGIFFLGLCFPHCRASDAPAHADGIVFQRCTGLCTHAYGVIASDATVVWPRARSEALSACRKRKWCAYWDLSSSDRTLEVSLPVLPGNIWPVFAGANIRSSDRTQNISDFGLFYQQRATFPSTIIELTVP